MSWSGFLFFFIVVQRPSSATINLWVETPEAADVVVLLAISETEQVGSQPFACTFEKATKCWKWRERWVWDKPGCLTWLRKWTSIAGTCTRCPGWPGSSLIINTRTWQALAVFCAPKWKKKQTSITCKFHATISPQQWNDNMYKDVYMRAWLLVKLLQDLKCHFPFSLHGA